MSGEVKSTADMFRSGLAAIKSGGNPLEAMGEVDESTDQIEGEGAHSYESEDYRPFGGDEEQENREEDSSTEDEGQEEAPSKSSKEEKTSGTKELVTVTDDKGKRQVEVDFSDREKLKKYVQLAHGGRKWQAERDRERQAHAQTQEKLARYESNWNAIEKAWQSAGVKGLVDFLEGREGAYEEYEEARWQRREALAKASPAERKAILAEEAATRQAEELERIRRENEEFRNSVLKEKEEAQVAALEAKVHPVFHKYSFEGKLGDPDTEELFDEMLWNKANALLLPYEEKGVEITPALIEKAYNKVAVKLKAQLREQAEKKASKVIDKKKREAASTLQADLKSGYKPNSEAQEFQELMDRGDTKSIFKNFGKFRGMKFR